MNDEDGVPWWLSSLKKISDRVDLATLSAKEIVEYCAADVECMLSLNDQHRYIDYWTFANHFNDPIRRE